VAGRRPQRRASICGPSSVTASAPNLTHLFSTVEKSGTVKEAGTPIPADKAQLQQLFCLSESDDDDDDVGGA